MADARYGRVLLKISGEALMGDESYGIDPVTVSRIAAQIKASSDLGTQIAVVVGGGNIWRGAAASVSGMDRATADYAGMLATMINALALQDAIEQAGGDVRTQTAIPVQQVAEPYIRRRAMRHLEKGRVVIFAAGMGNPYFTTDTPAALRAAEIEAEAILKGTHSGVDGVYTADPKVDDTAVRFDRISFMEVISRDLKIMDLTAVTFCKDNGLPILVFDLMSAGNIGRALSGEPIGTLIT